MLSELFSVIWAWIPLTKIHGSAHDNYFSLNFRTWVILSFVQKIGQNFHMKLRKTEHGDISILFHSIKQTVCKVLNTFQCGKYFLYYICP